MDKAFSQITPAMLNPTSNGITPNKALVNTARAAAQ